MKREVIIVLIVIAALAMLVVIGFVTKGRMDPPEVKIKSFIPTGWNMTLVMNEAPTLWDGEANCELIILENPTEKYSSSEGNSSATSKLWFCPKDWKGKELNIILNVPRKPAELVCDGKEYKIFYLAMQNNSLKNVPGEIKKYFG